MTEETKLSPLMEYYLTVIANRVMIPPQLHYLGLVTNIHRSTEKALLKRGLIVKWHSKNSWAFGWMLTERGYQVASDKGLLTQYDMYSVELFSAARFLMYHPPTVFSATVSQGF
jgi:hypothetical protein